MQQQGFIVAQVRAACDMRDSANWHMILFMHVLVCRVTIYK